MGTPSDASSLGPLLCVWAAERLWSSHPPPLNESSGTKTGTVITSHHGILPSAAEKERGRDGSPGEIIGQRRHVFFFFSSFSCFVVSPAANEGARLPLRRSSFSLWVVEWRPHCSNAASLFCFFKWWKNTRAQECTNTRLFTSSAVGKKPGRGIWWKHLEQHWRLETVESTPLGSFHSYSWRKS